MKSLHRFLYSINGEGRYTSTEVKRILGKPKLSITAAMRSSTYDIKVVAVKMVKYTDGDTVCTARTLHELAKKAYLDWTSLSKRLNHPESLKLKKYRVEEYWKEVK